MERASIFIHYHKMVLERPRYIRRSLFVCVWMAVSTVENVSFNWKSILNINHASVY